MPKIRFAAHNFPDGVLPAASPTELTVSRLELANEAARVGSSSHLGGYRRPYFERLWRATIVDAFLEERAQGTDSFWAKSQSFAALDPSEKTSVSFHLGLLQASVLTKKLLGLSDVVHVDAVLELMGIPRAGRRPDLVGYDPNHRKRDSCGRVLIESKGRSEATPSVVNRALGSAREQLEEFDGLEWNVGYALVGSNPLLIASVGHFTSSGFWQGVLEDPPPARDGVPPDVPNEAFQGLLNLASLRPIAAAIAEIQRYAPSQATRVEGGMTFARLPGIATAIGLPTEVYDAVERIAGTGSAPRVVKLPQAAEWAQGLPDRRQIANGLRDIVDREHQEEFDDFHLDDEGVLVAQLREGNSEEEGLEELLRPDRRG